MEAAMTAFIHSEAGLITAWVLILIGAADLVTGYLATHHFPQLLGEAKPAFDKIMPLLFFLAAFMLLFGLYMLLIRA